MKRRKFVSLMVGGGFIAVGGTTYMLSDRSNLLRADLEPDSGGSDALQPDERKILFLASLAPSGHNTQPWFVEIVEPFHWIVGNDRRKWLPAVDPEQRETMLSLGAFLQNLEYAAHAYGFECRWNMLAATCQDEKLMNVRLVKTSVPSGANVDDMKLRRTVRSGFLNDALHKEDVEHLVGVENDFIHYLPTDGKEAQFINRQTIEANRLQAYRDPAQEELADWIRFSSADARKHRDGLTTAGMEIEGAAGWMLRNFYDRDSVLKKDFCERGLDQVREEVSASAGWLLITSKNVSVETLLDTGRRMQRLFLKVRARGIALHPMTQILEEPSTKLALPSAIGLGENIQFILRVGYLASYPPPVSLRRPVSWFVNNQRQ